MNKKLLSSCLALTICTIAIAPIYKQLDLNNNNTVHPITEWNTLRSEKVSMIKSQLLSNGSSVTYPQNEENVVATSKVESNKTVAKTSTPSKKATTSTSTSKTSVKTTSKTITKATTTTPSKTVTNSTTSTKAVTSTNKTASRGSSTVSSSKATAVINTAKNYLGVPYVWGGTSPSGFDCSGFTQYVLSKNGISVPRTSAEQYKVGTSVSKSNLRVGDLVFFTTYKAGPSHLGFYIGDGNFIHASSSKGVTISSLSSSYYSSRYIGARRVIN